MAKESGIGNITVTVDNSAGTGKDISGDIITVGISTPRGMQDVTGLDKAGIERLLLLADGKVDLTGVFNDAADKSHAIFKNYSVIVAGSVGRTVALSVSGQTLSMEMVFDDYQVTRDAKGTLVWKVTGHLADGTAPAWS